MGDRREQNATSVLGVIYGQDKSVEKQERKKVDGMSTDTYFVPDTSTIKNHRLRAKLTQDECARLVCVTQATWARWEKGQCRITKLTKLTIKYLKQPFRHSLTHGTMYLTMSRYNAIMVFKKWQFAPSFYQHLKFPNSGIWTRRT